MQCSALLLWEELSYSKAGCASSRWCCSFCSRGCPWVKFTCWSGWWQWLLLAEVFILSSVFQSPSATLSTSPELIIVQLDHLLCVRVTLSLDLSSAQWDFLFPTEKLFKPGVHFPCAAVCCLCFWSSSPFCVTQLCLGQLCSVLMTDFFHCHSPILDGINSLYHSVLALELTQIRGSLAWDFTVSGPEFSFPAFS